MKGRHLNDPCGDQVVLRGVNEMFIWSKDLSGKESLREIAKTGTNVLLAAFFAFKRSIMRVKSILRELK